MKFFPELGLCFGGAAETTVTLPLPPPPPVKEQAPKPNEAPRPPCRGNRRRLMKDHTSTMQWKPELSAIAEDRVLVSHCGRKKEELLAGEAGRPPPAKRASKYGNDCRKPCQQRMVIPAFSPTPFVF